MLFEPDIRGSLPRDAQAPKAPANLLHEIATYLQHRAPPSSRVVVRNADYVAVRVRLAVGFKAGQDERLARQRLNQDLRRFLAPWAYDEGAELMIGGRVYAGSIVDFVDRREYVDHVAGLKLFAEHGGGHFVAVPDQPHYHVATERPDQVLVAAPQHDIDVVSQRGMQEATLSGIGHFKVELDFIVG